MKLDEFFNKTGNTVTSLASACGFHFSKIYRITRGFMPTLPTALRIEKETGGLVSPKDLLPEEMIKEIYGEN